MLPLLLLLLATAHGLDRVAYKPILASPDLGGRITASTFVLEQPRCAFPTNPNYTDAVIWLVVAESDAASNFSNSLEPGSSRTAYQSFPSGNPFYMTLGTSLRQYPCPARPGEITVLRVGTETSCAEDPMRPTCNGPLPGPGPYRVKFLAFKGSEPLAETDWSEAITLREALSPPAVTFSRHSPGMVALTAILSILFAILLASLVAMLIFGSSDTCGGSSTFTKPETVTVRKYNTHHVYDQPTARL
ncbi:uroplakin-3b-like protein 1 [Aegotheles albertisi]